jgi:serine/threonine-protein kinase RsbW
MNDAPPEGVELRLPARPRFLRLARLTASGFASDSGMDVEDLDDLRLAVGEACALLIDGAPESAALLLHYELSATEIVITGRCETANGAGVQVDEPAQAVLGATVDSFDLRTENGSSVFVLQKRCGPGPS